MKPYPAIQYLIAHAAKPPACFAVPFTWEYRSGAKRLFAKHPDWPRKQPRVPDIVALLDRGWALAIAPAALRAVVVDVDPGVAPPPAQSIVRSVTRHVGQPPALVKATLSGGVHAWYALDPKAHQPPGHAIVAGMSADIKASGYVLWHPSPEMWDNLAALPGALERATPLRRWPGQPSPARNAPAIDTTPVDLDAAQRTLETVKDNLSYDDWIRTGMALHAAAPTAAGFAAWHNGTARGAGDSEARSAAAWGSFQQGSVTFGTLVTICREHGADYHAALSAKRGAAAIDKLR